MIIGIQHAANSFSDRWIAYCKANAIEYKLVNCYANDITEQLKGCGALLWHHHQGSPMDIVFAKQLLFSVEQAGLKVFPDFNTGWHFDDKVGQKYLLESVNAPMVATHVYYSKKQALEWVASTSFPKVFKLRGGAGSANVELVNSKHDAVKLIRTAFGRGFKQYDALTNLKERWRKYKLGKSSFSSVMKGVLRFAYEPRSSRIAGRERGYVYFQDFIPANTSDTRIIVIDGKAFALKRMVRKNDFRASGSGDFRYERAEFDERCVRIAFDITSKLKAQCLSYDFVFKNGEPLVVEISYGFVATVYDPCPGYWDQQLNWYEEKFSPQGWMIEGVLKSAR